MSKCNVCSFLYPSDSSMDELFERIVKILDEQLDRPLCCYMLKDINITSKTSDNIAQEFMNKITMGFKEEKDIV